MSKQSDSGMVGACFIRDKIRWNGLAVPLDRRLWRKGGYGQPLSDLIISDGGAEIVRLK